MDYFLQINPFTHNIVKWPNILQKSSDIDLQNVDTPPYVLPEGFESFPCKLNSKCFSRKTLTVLKVFYLA